MFRRLIFITLTVLGLTTAANAQNKTSDFIRYSNEGNEPGLQIAVTDYVAPDTSTTVTLYGVVHIADEEYYKKVQKDLDSYDAVLYEGVGGPKDKMAAQKSKPSVLSMIPHLSGDVLGLKFQLESIDYTRKNLVHADVNSMEELNEDMKEGSVTPLGQYVKEDQLDFLKPLFDIASPLVKQLFKAYPSFQMSIKQKFAQQMAEADVTQQLSPEMYEKIVIKRNKIVIKVLKEQLEKHPENHTIAVFYGAAHMPDLEERLRFEGFKKQSKRFSTAWRIEAQEEDEDK